MKRYLTYVLGIAAMIFFAYMTTYMPEMLSTLFIAYIGVVMAITFLLTGRSVKKIIEDIEYIQEGKKLFSAKKETVEKLRMMDMPLLKNELKGQGLIFAIYFLPIILVIALIFFPQLRTGMISTLETYVKGYTADEHIARFAAYLGFYFTFYVVSILTLLANRLYQGRGEGGMLVIPSTYVVTDRGVILDERTPVKFPFRGEVKVNEKRKYVELLVESTGQPGSPQKVKYRLYTRQPRHLYEIISKLAKES